MRYYLLILISLLLTSCSSLQFRYGALTAVSHYDGIYYNKNSKVEVIAMEKSKDEEYVAFLTGKLLIMNEKKINQIYVFKKLKAISNGERDKFILDKNVIVKDR